MQSKVIKIAILALSLGVLSGCANVAQIEEAKAAANEALARANEAYNLAQKSYTIASESAYATEKAQSTAESALECCNANSNKLDRMFEKAMAK